MMNRILYVPIFLIFSFVYTQNNSSHRLSQFNLEDHLALEGYDAVSYFQNTKPKKGNKNFSTTYQGVTYYFVNQNNKQIFLSNPEKYEPQYGGWCAYAMGEDGDKVSVNPETYKIIDGKLYLFYNAYFNNTLKSWNKDEQNLKQKADKNWSKFFEI